MRVMFYCALFCFVAVVIVLAAAAPNILSDKNIFLKGFVNHEFLNVLGIIVAITLASSANLHLKFNDIEEKFKVEGGLSDTRRRVHQAAYSLIFLFLISIIIVVIKPNVHNILWAESLVNGAALFILFWNMLILLSITKLIFFIKPDIDDHE